MCGYHFSIAIDVLPFLFVFFFRFGFINFSCVRILIALLLLMPRIVAP